MRETTCCFTGHRAIPVDELPKLKQLLKQEVSLLIERGFDTFCCGGALGFDTLAAQAVIAAKKEHKNIRLFMFLPHPGQENGWKEQDKKIYSAILNKADYVSYASGAYVQQCMFTRDRQLVDASSVCVSYLVHGGGGTFYTISYARQCGLEIINLAKK